MTEGVPYARLRGFPELFAAYCEYRADVAGFFAGDWRRDEVYQSLAARIQTPVSSTLADTLATQNERWGNAVAHHIENLRRAGTLVVVTGQQVGVFGGPLYTLYKALTAVKLSERLSCLLQRPVVPVFWLEGGDHDLAEVSSLTLPGKTFRYQGHALPKMGNLGSVGKLPLHPYIDQLRADLRETLPNTEFRDTILSDWYGAYREGVSLTDAFARTMAAVLQKKSIVLMDPEDRAIKQLLVPTFERALTEHGEIYARLKTTSTALERNYHAQVRPRHTAPLFYQDNLGRNALYPDGWAFINRAAGQRMATSAFLQRVRTEPHRFSPNVVLRPLVQDTLLPTLAYVAGPGEVSYFAQFKALYEWASIPMPVIYPRASITVVEPIVRRVLTKQELSLESLQENVGTLLSRLVVNGSDVSNTFDQAVGTLDQIAESLAPAIRTVEATLSRAVASTHTMWLKDLSKLRRRVARAQKQKHVTLRSQLARSQELVFPAGKLQERVFPGLYYLSKYGPDFPERLFDALSLDTDRHQLFPYGGGA